jgi:hypothetical protein
MSELGTLPRCTAWSVANRIGTGPAPSLTAKLKPFAWAFLYALKQQGFLDLEVNYAAHTTDQDGIQRHSGAAALSDWQRLEMAIWAWARALAGSAGSWASPGPVASGRCHPLGCYCGREWGRARQGQRCPLSARACAAGLGHRPRASPAALRLAASRPTSAAFN